MKRQYFAPCLKVLENNKFSLYQLYRPILFFYSTMTLLPGDVILSGTPYGYGSVQNPPQFLQKGDILETEVENIGKMTHHII